MRRILACLFVGALFAITVWPKPQAWAQLGEAADRKQADEFVRLYDRWQQSQDPEEKIALGEQVLTLEPALKDWPLQAPREHVKGDLWFGLGVAYQFRRRGAHVDNVEKSIAHYEAALTARTHEVFPEQWAATQHGLSVAYADRIRGEQADNLEKAIAAAESALTIDTREARPQAWAYHQNRLAINYTSRLRGKRADNLEKAIAGYEAALTVFTREAFPQDWSMIQNNLGAVHIDHLMRGERADNLEKAIGHFEAALSVHTREAFPQNWATNQSNLARTYFLRSRGQRADNLEKAITGYEAALTVFTREAWPRDHLHTGRWLGQALLEKRDWLAAGPVYSGARQAFLLLFGQAPGEAEARDLIARAGVLFAEAAFAAAQRGENEAALALASEGRAQLLGVALKLKMLGIPDELRAAIRTAERTVEATKGTERAAALDKLMALRSELLGLVKRASGGDDRPRFTLGQARAVLATGDAIVVPVLTEIGSKFLIATAGNDGQSLTVLDLPELTTDRLDVLLRGERQADKLGGWLGAYNINYLPPAEQDVRWPEWLAAIDRLGPELWRLFAGRLDAALKERGLKLGARLVWLPTGALGILPLGLALDPVSKRRLADAYEIVYALSLEALTAAQAHIADAAPASLAVIINPTGDLAGTEKEGAIVASHFARRTRTLLEREAATPEAVLAALKGKTHWHFASHGTFSWEDARASALVMSGHTRLSVGRLLETDGLGSPRLVVLSACETGLYDIDRSPDEFVGLPGAFTALGAAGVLGTLWPVHDHATALLIAKFYELYMGAGLAPPTALSRAQAWLRQATNVDLLADAKVAARQGRLKSHQLTEIEQALSAKGLTRSRNRALIEWITRDAKPPAGKTRAGAAQELARPYAHPYFWAGFFHTGL